MAFCMQAERERESGVETPHAVQYAQNGNWPVGLTDVPKDRLPVANATTQLALYHKAWATS